MRNSTQTKSGDTRSAPIDAFKNITVELEILEGTTTVVSVLHQFIQEEINKYITILGHQFK